MQKIKFTDTCIKRLAKIVSFLYRGSIYRGSKFFKRCLYSAILENKFNGAEGLRYESDIFSVFIKGEKYIRIGRNFTCRRGLRLEAIDKYYDQKFVPEIIIHDNIDIGTECHIGAINKIEIGDGVLLGSKVYITDHSHGRVVDEEKEIPPAYRNLYSKGPVRIEDNVWIGDNVVILPGVSIGKGSIIGANAVVTKDVAPNSVAVGCPAKVLRKLSGDLDEKV